MTQEPVPGPTKTCYACGQSWREYHLDGEPVVYRPARVRHTDMYDCCSPVCARAAIPAVAMDKLVDLAENRSVNVRVLDAPRWMGNG